MDDIKDNIERLYGTVSKPGSFSSVNKLYHAAKKNKGLKLSKTQIKQWLSNQESYTSLINPSKPKLYPKVIVHHIDSQWDIDLMSMENISTENDNVKFLLIALDILSKYGWVRPLKRKTGLEVTKAMNDIFETGRKPKSIRADNGKEFLNKWFLSLMENESIYFFTSVNKPKANFAERLIKTLRLKMYRYFHHKTNYRYLDDLQKIISSYNHTFHNSIQSYPAKVNKSNESKIWSTLYLNTSKQRNPIPYKYSINDLVKLSKLKQTFSKSHTEKWTNEIFIIRNRFRIQGFPMYKVKDFHNQNIKGNFYQNELMKVTKDIDSLWFIEKLIKKKKKDGEKEKMNGWLSGGDGILHITPG